MSRRCRTSFVHVLLAVTATRIIVTFALRRTHPRYRHPVSLLVGRASERRTQQLFSNMLEQKTRAERAVGTATFFDWAACLPKRKETTERPLQFRVAKELEATAKQAVEEWGFPRLSPEEQRKCQNAARKALGKKSKQQKHIKPVAWYNKPEQILSVVISLPVDKCVGVHSEPEIRGAMDVALCILDLAPRKDRPRANAHWVALPLLPIEVKVNMRRQIAFKGAIRQGCIYSFCTLAGRKRGEVLCVDQKRVIGFTVIPAQVSGDDALPGKLYTGKLVSDAAAVSSLICNAVDLVLSESEPTALTHARTRGIWSGFIPSTPELSSIESRYGSVWRKGRSAVIRKVVSRIHDCRHSKLCENLQTAMEEAHRAMKEARKSIKSALRSGTHSDSNLSSLKQWIRSAKRAPLREKPCRSSNPSAELSCCKVRQYASLLKVYCSVPQASDWITEIWMWDKGHPLVGAKGFGWWSLLPNQSKLAALEGVTQDLLFLCEAEWLHWDCRLENLVVSREGRLSAIDLDWIERARGFANEHVADTENLWYPAVEKAPNDAKADLFCDLDMTDSEDEQKETCRVRPEARLYLCWQAYVCSWLLMSTDNLPGLRRKLAAVYCAPHHGWDGMLFPEFVDVLCQLGYPRGHPAQNPRAPPRPRKLSAMVMKVVSLTFRPGASGP